MDYCSYLFIRNLFIYKDAYGLLMDLVHEDVHCYPDASYGTKLEYISILCICNINEEQKNAIIREMLCAGERKKERKKNAWTKC
jgi:hypothetical protein